jgi:acetoin:2,6-dichlorophenolindophenol oxidoreductase subunit alpha
MAAPKTKRPSQANQTSVENLKAAHPPCTLATDASPSNPDVLRTLYAALLKTRMLEEQVLALLRAGKLPGVPVPILGGEATEIGACIGLRPDDSFASSQPTLATHAIQGTSLERVFAQLLNPQKHAQEPTAHNAESLCVVPQSATVAAQLDVAAGVALAYRQLAKPNVVVALAHDGLALGFWHEAATLASRHRLPIVFMVENCAQSHPNSAAVHSDDDLRDRAEAYGIPGITVDGNDIVAVWRVTQESIHRARSGAGPTLIECRTWRWHAEADTSSSNGRSRTKLRWQNDPLHHMEHYMKKRKLWNQAWKENLVEEYRAALIDATALAEAATNKG